MSIRLRMEMMLGRILGGSLQEGVSKKVRSRLIEAQNERLHSLYGEELKDERSFHVEHIFAEELNSSAILIDMSLESSLSPHERPRWRGENECEIPFFDFSLKFANSQTNDHPEVVDTVTVTLSNIWLLRFLKDHILNYLPKVSTPVDSELNGSQSVAFEGSWPGIWKTTQSPLYRRMKIRFDEFKIAERNEDIAHYWIGYEDYIIEVIGEIDIKLGQDHTTPGS